MKTMNHLSIISIHALREEGDNCVMGYITIFTISIHALREEGDEKQRQLYQRQADFYPRPPRGGRLPGRRNRWTFDQISIHALREEGDK